MSVVLPSFPSFRCVYTVRPCQTVDSAEDEELYGRTEVPEGRKDGRTQQGAAGE